MKKFLSFVFAMIFSVTFLMPVISHANNQSNATSETLSFEESITQNKNVIVSTEKTSLSGQLLAQSVENSAPFDSSTETLKTGVIIEPSANSYGEVSSSYSVSSFSLSENKSVYMWIFIPDENIYDLKVTFSSTLSGSISWEISNFNLSNMMSKAGTLFGWKLLEFCVNDATKNTTGELAEISFNQLKIEYTDSLELEYKYSNNKFAFYDVYLADSYSNSSGIIQEISYVNYKINTTFFYNLNNVFVGDTLTISNSRAIFEYIYAGKQNLKNYTLNSYTFEFTFTNSSSQTEDVEFGKEYVFEKKGFYSLNLKIYEYRVDESVLILNYGYTGYCDEFGPGAFSDVNYELKYGETRSIHFSFTDSLIIDGNVKVTSSDGNIVEIQSYEIKNGKCYIQLKGKKDGKVKISVSLNGHREGVGESSSYSVSTNITVKEKDNFSLYLTIVWIAFGIYFVVIMTFIIISFVKARKFGVK